MLTIRSGVYGDVSFRRPLLARWSETLTFPVVSPLSGRCGTSSYRGRGDATDVSRRGRPGGPRVPRGGVSSSTGAEDGVRAQHDPGLHTDVQDAGGPGRVPRLLGPLVEPRPRPRPGLTPSRRPLRVPGGLRVLPFRFRPHFLAEYK